MARRRCTCEVPQRVGHLVFETRWRVETEKLLFSEGDQSLRDNVSSAVTGSACQNSGIGVAVKDLSNGLDNRDGLSRARPRLPIKSGVSWTTKTKELTARTQRTAAIPEAGSR